VVSVWDGSVLMKRENWSSVWCGSLSPGISGLLSVDSSVSSGFGGGVGIFDGGLEVIVVKVISIRNGSSADRNSRNVVNKGKDSE
jgi:hypothetical protein